MKQTVRRSSFPEASIPDFNRTQLHIMQLLWNADNALKPAELEERFEWPIENATLRSVLSLMLERGDIRREKRGKAYFYFPLQRKEAVVRDILGGLAKVFGSGSRVGLISQLIQEDSLTEEEVLQLRQLADASQESGNSINPKN